MTESLSAVVGRLTNNPHPDNLLLVRWPTMATKTLWLCVKILPQIAQISTDFIARKGANGLSLLATSHPCRSVQSAAKNYLPALLVRQQTMARVLSDDYEAFTKL